MPTYLYACECGHQEDVVHSIFDTPALLCPSCKQELKKKPTAPTVTFNGTGFYRTDSR